MAPVRPYGLSYTGGAQKSIRGNCQFFEMDQNRIGGVINQVNNQKWVNTFTAFFVAE